MYAYIHLEVSKCHTDTGQDIILSSNITLMIKNTK